MCAPAAEGIVRDLGVAREVEVAVRVGVDGTKRLVDWVVEVARGVGAADSPIGGRSRRREEQKERDPMFTVRLSALSRSRAQVRCESCILVNKTRRSPGGKSFGD